VVATNSPIIDTLALHTKMAPYRTYAMVFSISRGAIPDALYWDTLDPYHYVRLQPSEGTTDYLIVGGADHKTGESDDAEKRFDELEAWARNLIPAAKEVTHRWSGQVLDTIDYAAFIGRNPGNASIYVHTGDSGQGMTHGVVGSLINSALILGENPKWQEVYETGRNLTAVKNFAEYLAPGELSSLDDLQPGQGAIVRKGLTKVAAYRDRDGILSAGLAACTRLLPALELVRSLLGLSVPWLPFLGRWHGA
jgi:FAD dependent oxidoreductase